MRKVDKKVLGAVAFVGLRVVSASELIKLEDVMDVWVVRGGKGPKRYTKVGNYVINDEEKLTIDEKSINVAYFVRGSNDKRLKKRTIRIV